MYSIHTTPGFIIESRPSGEAGKLLSIFTRDLGLVLTTAQGIRLEKSKLRYHSQEYSFGEFSFVRGKEFWRLTNAGEMQRVSSKEKGGRSTIHESRVTINEESSDYLKESKKMIGRIVLLLRRLLNGEEPHPELFEHIKESFLFLESYATPTNDFVKLSAEQLQTLESVIVFRILHLLGYIGADKNLDQRLVAGPFSASLLDEATGQRMNMNRHINKALRESHL